MFDWLKRTKNEVVIDRTMFGPSGEMQAASQLAVVPVPKVPSKQQTYPSLLTTATPNPDVALIRQDRQLANSDPTTIRTGTDTRVVMRDMVAVAPDLSATVNAYLRTAITADYTAVARNMDGTFNRDATALLQQLLTRFDVVQDYEDGFSGINSMRSNSESLSKELLTYGAMGLELVLGKDRLPRTLQPISVTQIVFFPDKSGKYLRPIQRLSGVDVDLDIPTFFYTSVDQVLLDTYASSPLESAIQPTLFMMEFMNDLRRIVKKVVHPRLTVTIDEDKFRKTLPMEILHDEKKLQAHMSSIIAEVESKINGLTPEEALVYFDTLGFDLLNNGNISLDKEWTVLHEIVNAKMTTGAKALPSILGHGSGSQNIASSETLLFMKNAEGMVQAKLNEIYSRALTLAVRLFGLDVYVQFKYGEIDLRPDAELEAFKAMKQSRVLELLSLGFIEDDQAAMELTGQLTPAGFTTLSGTGFYTAPAAGTGATNGNPNSGTSTAAGGGNNAAQQARKPKTPTQPKTA